MQWIASGFLFIRGHTFFHRLDPRVRLSVTLSIFVVSLFAQSIVLLLLLVALVFGIVGSAKTLHRFGRSMVLTTAISVVAVVINYIVKPSSPHEAIVFGVRLFAVISSTSLFFLTSTPDELEQVMKWFRLPSDFVMIFVIAIRFVPVLMLDALQIMDAQRSRGLEFDKGNFIKRLRNSIPIIIPLIAVALNRSLDLAEAMDSRAYGATKRPTSLYKPVLSSADYAVLSIVAAGLVLGIYVSLYVSLF